MNIHVTLLPYIKTAGEVKTKDAALVKALREIGIQPDIILCRHEHPLESNTRDKISLFCNVEKKHVILAPDVDCIYDLPERLHREGFDDAVADLMDIWSREPDISAWSASPRCSRPRTSARSSHVGKYVTSESYKSLHEALVHGGVASGCKVELRYIDAEAIEADGAAAHLSSVDGVLVPGGFGERGVEGKVLAVQFARENAVPYFGICLGMQIAVIEFSRHVVGLQGAHSTEFQPGAAHPVIHLMEEQRDIQHKGASMRLGAYPCLLREGSLAHRVYGTTRISERHRHRYEVNTDYREQFESKGLLLSGMSPDGSLPEMCEIADHPYFVACQFHPEFKSRPTRPHPLFTKFVAACLSAAQRDAAVA